MTDKELLEKAIYWFRVIAEDMERITTGNLSHCAATTKGRAIRAYEFLEKHKEEPVSEDLEEAVNTYIGYPPEVDECSSVYGKRQAFKAGAKWQKQQDSIPSKDLAELIDTLSKRYPEVSFAKLSRIAVRVAKWQKQQFEKNRLAACDRQTKEEAEREQDFVDKILLGEHRRPTFSDAIEYGMKWQKEQLTKNAVERVVKVDAGGYPYIDCNIELYDYSTDTPLAKAGDKVKIIIVKED